MRRLAIAVVALAALPPSRLAAMQCPDGAPPPCRGQVAAARRALPPLDERTWIVVPFENVARAPDIDWLKDAAVNLLYLDMSKWQDIRVIDDERVADLVREVPEARGGQPLTLQSGIAVARRAGAGKLVMGDLLKVGSRTQLIAKVFDVRTGQRIRTVRQLAPVADSIMGAFGLLARAVLNVEPPAGTSLGTIGTSSIGAYQAYLEGVSALNRWILDSAQQSFTRALTLDSTFALAHYKLALVYGWRSAGNSESRRHADLALRLGTGLPQRERSLVTGYAAFAANRYGDACEIFQRMVQADSNDVEAWYNLGECSYHDPVVVRLETDTTRYAFRGNWNSMLRAFRRVLALDPTYHLAFQHIQDALLTGQRNGCRPAAGETGCTTNNSPWAAALRRAGDTLVLEPVDLVNDQNRFASQQVQAALQHARRQNLEEARRAAEDWLAAGPAEVRPRMAYTRILLRLGQVRAADSAARLVSTASMGRVETGNFSMDRIEIALKVGRIADAARIADSLRRATDTITEARALGVILNAVMGHVEPVPDVIRAQVQGPPWVTGYFSAQALAVVGLVPDSLFSAEAVFARNVAAGQGVARANNLIVATLAWTDPRERHGQWPALDSSSADPRVKLMAAVASGDTARITRALTTFDSVVAGVQDEPDNGVALAGAYAHLAIGDSAGALHHLRTFRDVTWPHSPILDQIAPGFAFAGLMWPRTFLMLGDLAAATGQRDEALAAYRTFIAMWQGGDAAVQPMVQRARSAVARLGG